MANASASSPTNPHFFKPLLPSFQSHLNIPMTFFSKHIRGTTNEDNAVVTLTSDASDKTWEVKMDGRRLTRGWQNFANGHGLRVGDIVIFRRDGDLLFHVTSFGPSCCQILYDDVIQVFSDSDSEKYHQDTREEGSPSDNSCFVARVTASNLSRDMLFLPRGFSRSNGLTNRKCEIILLNEDGKPWKVFMSYHKTHGRVYIRTGWRRFCRQNRRRSNDLLTFKLVETGTKPVLQLCSSVYNRDCLRDSSSTSQDRFLTLTLTPYSIRKSKLCLPAAFLKSNGITNARKIILVDRYGIKRTTSLKPDNNNGAMRMGKGWRELCKANGVKAGESFTLELIKEEGETATHLLKFCTKV
ncbi:B3 domain-containing protein REM10-like [Brassica napus]|uniref:B3 domain-containing protein REM10-like n=1 Tax=Brassica napus TaxID=3708 RepID=UPI00207918F2|nr:B3 domain-containing protein REM10-like [Brassica napus]